MRQELCTLDNVLFGALTSHAHFCGELFTFPSVTQDRIFCYWDVISSFQEWEGKDACK
jgi:hypothetical protein